MATEADTCRRFVVQKLQAAGWDSGLQSIAEKRSFTDGRIVLRGSSTEVFKWITDRLIESQSKLPDVPQGPADSRSPERQ